MRYRPFGASGKAVSAVSLLLREAPNMTTPQAWRALVFGAMENGINCFEITAGSDVMQLGVGEALRAVERRLIFLGYRLRGDGRTALTAETISQSVRSALEKTGAAYFDLLTMDEAAYETLAPGALEYLTDLRAAGMALQIGVVGDGPIIDTCIGTGAFDVLEMPFNLTSDWHARRRIKDASAANMVLVGYDLFPTHLTRPGAAAPMRSGGLLRRAEPLAGSGTYAFLHTTSNWTSEELCLAYALTEPAFATFRVEIFRADAIARVSAATDKDLPTGVAAQIEMARFSVEGLKRHG
jgi:aryl-alcohol dehydrogenase-like predicted oxidoreductase